jgi:hypothetical protein
MAQGWSNVYTFDDNLKLRASGTNITISTAGTAQSTGFMKGQIAMLLLNVESADFTTGNETYEVKIQGSSDGVTYQETGCVITLETSGSPAAYVTGEYEAPVLLKYDYYRYYVTVAGTTPILDVEIRMAARG